MKFFDITFPTPEQNLACDEALLELCEEGQSEEVLRFWESSKHFVVLGYSNRLHSEVRVEDCRAAGVPILRRCSGGGTVLQGPGCLSYALVLRLQGPYAESIRRANQLVMERHRGALESLVKRRLRVDGDTDLVLDDRKFSGNSQRRKKNYFLFHGTFLLQLDIARVQRFLRAPSREPAYRGGRAHSEFVTNVRLRTSEIKAALKKTWRAENEAGVDENLEAKIAELAERHKQKNWIERFR